MRQWRGRRQLRSTLPYLRDGSTVTFDVAQTPFLPYTHILSLSIYSAYSKSCRFEEHHDSYFSSSPCQHCPLPVSFVVAPIIIIENCSLVSAAKVSCASTTMPRRAIRISKAQPCVHLENPLLWLRNQHDVSPQLCQYLLSLL